MDKLIPQKILGVFFFFFHPFIIKYVRHRSKEITTEDNSRSKKSLPELRKAGRNQKKDFTVEIKECKLMSRMRDECMSSHQASVDFMMKTDELRHELHSDIPKDDLARVYYNQDQRNQEISHEFAKKLVGALQSGDRIHRDIMGDTSGTSSTERESTVESIGRTDRKISGHGAYDSELELELSTARLSIETPRSMESTILTLSDQDFEEQLMSVDSSNSELRRELEELKQYPYNLN